MEGVNSKTLASDAPCPPLAPGKLRCYNMRYSPFGERALLALSVKSIPVEIVNVNSTNKNAWLFDKNPLGLVPILEKDGQFVYESLVVAEFLDEVHPEKPLLPRNPLAKAHQKMLLERLTTGLNQQMLAGFTATDSADSIAKLNGALKCAEELLTADYYSGAEPGFVDYMEWPFFERIQAAELATGGKVVIGEYPKVAAFIKRMLARPEVKAVAKDPAQHLEFFGGFAQGKPNFDL